MQNESSPSRLSRRCLLRQGVFAAATVGLAAGESMTDHAAHAEENPLASLKRGHPRLIASSDTWATLQKRRANDTLLDAFLKRSEQEARALLTAPPVVYKKAGRRLLSVSRTALRRVLLLAFHANLSADAAITRRAVDEMKAVAAFSDWNPSHFLDVGEMTAALAFGYDWLYGQLDADTRKTIATAIVEHGLKPGLKPGNGWLRTENNWNQVCLGGLTLGALALADEEPTLAAQTLAQTRQFNSYGLKPYIPDGVYPEGASYWGYGTTYQTVLLAALQSALGTDWGLSKAPGFLTSGDATNQMIAPSGRAFNFSDGGERVGLEPAMWWYGHTLKRPELLQQDMRLMREYATSPKPADPSSQADRLLPLVALWWPETSSANAAAAFPRYWTGNGPNPLAVFRDAWNDPKAMYLALKGGSASVSHAHMDAGTFIFEANGVRWGYDLGAQDYLSLESRGVDLWNKKQDGQRWDVFRLGPFSHSTLTINNQRHRVDGHAAITHFADSGETIGAIVDLSPVFAGQATRVGRGFAYRLGQHVLIRDEIAGVKTGETVRWAMLTRADIQISPDGTQATLTQDGQTLQVRLQSSVPAKWEVVSAEKPPQDFDAPNPGANLLAAHLIAPASGAINLSVLLQPGTAAARSDALAQTRLREWNLPPNKRAPS